MPGQRVCEPTRHGGMRELDLEGVGHSRVHVVHWGDRVPSLGPVEVGDGVASLRFIGWEAGVCGGEGRCFCHAAGSGKKKKGGGGAKGHN